MDLDFQQRRDLADYLIERYVAYSKDTDLTKVLGFYKCYRAYVRGKVISFKLDDPNVSQKEKAEASKEAQKPTSNSPPNTRKNCNTLDELVSYPIGNFNRAHNDGFLVAIASASHH